MKLNKQKKIFSLSDKAIKRLEIIQANNNLNASQVVEMLLLKQKRINII